MIQKAAEQGDGVQRLDRVGGEAPIERGADVVDLGVEPREPGRLGAE